MKEAKCSNCFYFDGIKDMNGLYKGRGYCRFNPPVLVKENMGEAFFQQSTTSADSFCSNHPMLQNAMKGVLVQIGREQEKERERTIHKMKKFRITSNLGVEMGIYEAENHLQALEKMAKDAGYSSALEAEAVAGHFNGTIEEVED